MGLVGRGESCHGPFLVASSTWISFASALRLLRAAAPVTPRGRTWQRKGAAVLNDTQDTEEIIARVAALDIGKTELVACVRPAE